MHDFCVDRKSKMATTEGQI